MQRELSRSLIRLRLVQRDAREKRGRLPYSWERIAPASVKPLVMGDVSAYLPLATAALGFAAAALNNSDRIAALLRKTVAFLKNSSREISCGI